MAPFGFESLENKRQSINKPAAAAHQETRLTFERLETRLMLAADMAEIVGVVRTDLQGDGNASNDTVVADAGVTLYRDGGNGVFGGDDTIVGSTSTDASGQYRFDQIGAGKYFVKVSLPADLQFRAGGDVREVNISVDDGDGVVGPAIDGFTTSQIVEASPPLPSSQPASLVDGSVLGGERDMWVELTESNNPISSVALATNGGNLYVASGPGATGNAKVVWDGLDGDGLLVNPTGLGGIDLTEHDGNTMTGIALTSGADHPNAKITMRIYTDAGNWSEFTTTVPESAGGAATGKAIFNFSDTPTAQGGQGADFTNVGALELTFEGVSALDGQVSLVGLVGRATKRADFTALPRLTVGNHVWADIDDDGIHQASEAGIADVKLNLYEDTNGDNQYTQGVDALLAMTTTNANGDYLFQDLFPGKYVVQVDPTNFQPQGPLAGLRSSSGNGPAADPDNDVNGDDNGTALAGAGVVSQAVMLSGDAEPTNDGDSNPNTNLTVDFGFFGFDLVLDKAVEQTSVAPQETIDYTIKIDNDGPSAAADTTFVDTLPDAATFVSASATFNGSPFDARLQHAGGVVTAEFGTMQPGDVVIVTILATVDDDAEGILVNTATVSAPKEVDLSNNTDTVSNPVTPRIDLAITKTDSRDPVDPGSTFHYTLDIVNNGPSDATGVIVTDNLPSTGVSFVSASLTPASVSGNQLIFDLGNLDNGESRSITIEVRVDQEFSGELLNHTEVRGNEEEVTYVNNEDTEPTLVEVEPASLGGSVFVDRNDNGVFDDGESPIEGVLVTLKGIDRTGATVVRSTTTEADGSYLFDNLAPGTYRVEESQPERFRDGQDHLGTQGGALGIDPGPFLIPNDVEPEQLQDLFFEIQLESGDVGLQYDFGELAINPSKGDFIGAANWWR
ncbi:MAG: carboxypeptidase regulatory-like domain-containing protein [Pirellulales bacterium]|nr:carboxypeptidase regulatory-like domain-containing protein [Pirellulales bacterium]